MATIWPAPGGGGGGTTPETNVIADEVESMVSYQ